MRPYEGERRLIIFSVYVCAQGGATVGFDFRWHGEDLLRHESQQFADNPGVGAQAHINVNLGQYCCFSCQVDKELVDSQFCLVEGNVR